MSISVMISQWLLVKLYLVIITITLSYSVPNPLFDLHHSTHDNKSRDLIVGSRSSDDHIVIDQNIIKSSSWMQKNVIKESFNVTKGQTITQIRALDQSTKGHGGHVSILNGGPGNNNVTLKFKSERDHGIHFKVQIYATT